jgi:hypothetical protein
MLALLATVLHQTLTIEYYDNTIDISIFVACTVMHLCSPLACIDTALPLTFYGPRPPIQPLRYLLTGMHYC